MTKELEDRDLENIAAAMEKAYNSEHNRENAVAYVLYYFPYVSLELLRGMWEAIDRYADMVGKEISKDPNPENPDKAPVRIIQLLAMDYGSRWDGRLLGLGSDGITYECNSRGFWVPFIPEVGVEK